MSKNLYEDLGVGKDASPEEIKQAYKKLAKENHPDTGGNTEKFQEVSHAYSVLKDPGKRSDYDSHGEERDQSDQSYHILTGIFETLLSKSEDLPPDFNILEEMKNILDQMIRKIRNDRKQINNHVKRYKKLLKRFKRKKAGSNFFVLALEKKIREGTNRVNSATKARTDAKKARNLLNDYEWEGPSTEEMEEWLQNNMENIPQFFKATWEHR